MSGVVNSREEESSTRRSVSLSATGQCSGEVVQKESLRKYLMFDFKGNQILP